MRLKDKVVVISGAAQGIGEAIATSFAEDGAQVIVTDINDTGGQALTARLGGSATYYHLDVTEEAEWTSVIGDTIRRFGRVDGLVNNAAVYIDALIEKTPTEDARRLIDIDLVGPWLGMKAVVPHMKAARCGSIVNISSVDGMIGYCGCTAYTAAKWGLRGMTKSVAKELGPFGVRANLLNPGAIDTPIVQAGLEHAPFDALFGEIAMNRLGRADEVAAACAFLISDDSTYVSGADLTIDGALICGVYQLNKPSLEA